MASGGEIKIKVSIEGEVLDPKPEIVGMDGEDRLTLQHCTRQPLKGTQYPDYLTMHIGGDGWRLLWLIVHPDLFQEWVVVSLVDTTASRGWCIARLAQ